MEHTLRLMIMSGVEDGASLELSSEGDGKKTPDKWTLTVGRRDDNDVCLRNDTFVSREHAKLHWMDSRWWLEDCESTNGTFIENVDNYFDDKRVKGIIPLGISQLFRIGRTWLRIQPVE